MKGKFYSLILAIAATPAFAGTPSPSFAGLMSAAQPATEADVIWTPPCITEGNSYTFQFEVGVKGFSRQGIKDISYNVSNGQKGEMVADTRSDKYYVKNPLPRTAIGSYIEGTLVEDGDDIYIECQLPQWLNAREATNTGVVLSLGKETKNPDGQLFYDPETDLSANVIRYRMDENEDFVLDVPEGYALAAFYQYLDEDFEKCVFANEAVYHVKYNEPGRKQAVTIPDNVEPKEWGMLYSNGERAHKVTGAIDGNTVYIAGFNPAFPESCVTGTIDGDKVTFEANQYIGETASTYEYLVLNIAEFVSSSDRGDVYDFQGSPLPSVEAAYDAEAGTISCPMNIAWFSNAGTDELYYSAYYVGPMFTPNNGGKAATPVDPEIVEVQNYMPEFGYGGFIVDMPLLSTEGEVLDKDKYTYIVYFDDEPYTFDPDIFPGLTEPMTEIPYDFEDGEAQDFSVEGISHIICWRTDGFSNVGIQALYTVDGVTNRSDIVSYQLSGIDEIQASQAVAVEYYNLTGARVQNPQNGIYVKKIVFENGKTLTEKTIIK